jgi:hypothetical protein
MRGSGATDSPSTTPVTNQPALSLRVSGGTIAVRQICVADQPIAVLNKKYHFAKGAGNTTMDGNGVTKRMMKDSTQPATGARTGKAAPH